MNEQQQLNGLVQALLADEKVTAQAGWHMLILVARAEASTSMAGYSFDGAGAFKPVSPGLPAMLPLRQLRQSMTVSEASGRGWKACLLRIGPGGGFAVDFEYNDGARWAVTPANLEQRIQEFAAMPV